MAHIINPHQLGAFVAVAELASFSLASRRLNLSTSAVSALIQQLEARLGFSLFERTTRKVALTQEGRAFLPSAMAVQRQMSRANDAATDILNRAVESVRIAAPMAVAAFVLPPLIAQFRSMNGDTMIRILDTAVEWLSDRVDIGEAELALGPDRAVPPTVRRDKLFPSRWVLWCRPDHPLARCGDDVRWSDLMGADIIAAGRDHEHSVQPLLPEGSEAAKVQPRQIVDNISTSLGFAAAGLGVTFSPDYVAPFADRLGLVQRALIEPEIVRHMTLYQPTDRRLSRAAQRFRDYLIEMLGSGQVDRDGGPVSAAN